MNVKTILLPVDLAACPLEGFWFVNQFASETSPTVILLHVLKLNIVAHENRFYAGVAQEAEEQLTWIKHKFLSPRLDSRVCVRMGKPAPEIVTEAAESRADLIVMTNHLNRYRPRLFQSGIMSAVASTAPCPVRVLRVVTWLDCPRQPALRPGIMDGLDAAPPSWAPGLGN
jgi:nucleotide-binding universal stress UspA family protein